MRHQAPDQKAFADALILEIAHMAARQPGREVTSIFFGGGTPSLMQPETVESVLNAIAVNWSVKPGIEITMEANPSSVEAGRFKAYRSAGVNRVSLGVQSLDDQQLGFLGRLHSAEEARNAVSLARDIFPRLSFDLIYARPDQTLEDWRSELEEAIALAADHLSLYQLTIEQGTPFYNLHRRGKLTIPDPEYAASLFELTQEITTQHGLPAYEISNHAVPGSESRHNLTYWRFGSWAGVGPGAHGRLLMNDGRHATSTERHPETWLKQVQSHGHGLVEDDVLTHEEVADEMLLMGLRLKEGLDLTRHQEETGVVLDQARIDDLVGHNMIERLPKDRLRATAEGWLVLDAVIADLAA